MPRPSRQLTNLSAKIAEKESRSHKKPGKRTKRWRKWLDRYKTIANPESQPAEAGAS